MSKIVKVGIDLGTTNSEITFINEDGDVELIDNIDNMKFTPSAVYIDKDGEVSVGKDARDALQHDPENVAKEFKREMGDKKWRFKFSSTGKEMSAPELSAEVLKSLLTDAERKLGKRPNTAVITVPEAFYEPMKNDTIMAGENENLAGIKCVELLKEPVAACHAYASKLSSERRPDRVYWLVYDLGGGTFDAALVWVEGGIFTIRDHEGNIKLGGTDIDENIMRMYNVPEFIKQHPIYEDRVIEGESPLWWTIKTETEESKIRISNLRKNKTFRLTLREQIEDESVDIAFSYSLDELMIATAMAPVIKDTLEKIDTLLQKNSLQVEDLERVIIVGGPTQSPVLRETLRGEYPWNEELLALIPEVEREATLERLTRGLKGTEIDHSIDPITAVAQGAAIFAESIEWPKECIEENQREKIVIVKSSDTKKYGVDRPEYVLPEVGTALICGVVFDRKSERPVGTGWEVRVESKSMEWRTGRIGVDGEGRFSSEVSLNPERDTNKFAITVFDRKGRTYDRVLGSEFSILFGDIQEMVDRDIGVGLARYGMDILLYKGEIIPDEGLSRESDGHKTTLDLKPSETGARIVVPVYEGKAQYSLGNKKTGEIIVESKDVGNKSIPRDTRVKVIGSARKAPKKRILIDIKLEFPNLFAGELFPVQLFGDTSIRINEFAEKLLKIDFLTCSDTMEEALKNIRFISDEDLSKIKERAWQIEFGHPLRRTHGAMKLPQDVFREYSQDLKNFCGIFEGRIEVIAGLLRRYKDSRNERLLQDAEQQAIDIIRRFGGDMGSDETDWWKEAEWPHLKVASRVFANDVRQKCCITLSEMDKEKWVITLLGLLLMKYYGIESQEDLEKLWEELSEEDRSKFRSIVEGWYRNFPEDKEMCGVLTKEMEEALEENNRERVETVWETLSDIHIVSLILFGEIKEEDIDIY